MPRQTRRVCRDEIDRSLVISSVTNLPFQNSNRKFEQMFHLLTSICVILNTAVDTPIQQ